MTSCSFHIVIDHTDRHCNIQRIDSIRTSQYHGDEHHYYCESTTMCLCVCVYRKVCHNHETTKGKQLTNSTTHLCNHHLVSQMVLDNIQYHTCTLPGYQQVMNLILDMDDTSQCYYERT